MSRNTPKITKPSIDNTIKIICGIKFPSVMLLLGCLWLLLGVRTKANINIAGTNNPKIEYISGLLELLQARHQIIEKIIAIIIINVPTPMPKTRVLEEVSANAYLNKANINNSFIDII
jgi:hypothetical protein